MNWIREPLKYYISKCKPFYFCHFGMNGGLVEGDNHQKWIQHPHIRLKNMGFAFSSKNPQRDSINLFSDNPTRLYHIYIYINLWLFLILFLQCYVQLTGVHIVKVWPSLMDKMEVCRKFWFSSRFVNGAEMDWKWWLYNKRIFVWHWSTKVSDRGALGLTHIGTLVMHKSNPAANEQTDWVITITCPMLV